MKARNLVYHSALSKPLRLSPVSRVEAHGCIAFVHDIFSGRLPQEYRNCDLFYADLPWRAGFRKFEQRAGTEHDYQEFMSAVNRVISGFPRGILVCGKTELLYLHPDRTQPAILNGASAVAAIYGDLKVSGAETWEILSECALTYNVIGDFLCGYGRAGWIFYSQGKRFVMSDHNAQCIGYIASWLGG